MEQDERGREVRRRAAPGRRWSADDLPAAFPVFEHSEWTVEGRIERIGAFARGLRDHRPNAMSRIGGTILLLAVLAPVVMLLISLLAAAISD